MNTFKRVALLALGFAIALPATAAAAIVQADFTNGTRVSALYFWALDSSTAFDEILFGEGMDGWSIVRHTNSRVVLTGPALAPGAGLFGLEIGYGTPSLAFEWAEVLFDGTYNHVQASGTRTLAADGTFAADGRFTHLRHIPDLAPAAVVPIPPAALLMASGLLLLPLARRPAR